MAFVFLQETGSGTVAGANSYAGVAEADDYFTPTAQNTVWSLLTTTQKENLLVQATRALDVFTRYEGTKTVETSPLRWPRSGVTNRDCIGIGVTTIPTELKQATYELAYLLNTVDLNATPDTEGIKRILVDVIEVEFQEGPRKEGVQVQRIPSIVNAALHGIGSFSLGGPRFARIRRA